MAKVLFIIISVLVAMTSCLIAGKAQNKKSREGSYLACCLYSCAAICLTYLVSILTPDKFVMSIFSSTYFACFDVTLITLMLYIRSFVGGMEKKSPLMILPLIYATFDIVTLMSNPWTSISLTYRYSEFSLQHWRYVPGILYQMHLMFTYVLVAIIFAILIYKSMKTPAVYKSRYYNVFAALAVVVGMNAIFLFLPKNNLPDLSVPFYSVAGFILYWNNYNYVEKGMFNRTRQVILDEMTHPMVLFDYERKLVLSNQAALSLCNVPCHGEKLTLDEFINYHEFNELNMNKKDDVTFQWINDREQETISYRCDFHVLRDKKKGIVGYLFVFTDISRGLDLLTGFENINEFTRFYKENSNLTAYPVSVTAFDINDLHGINSTCGETAGDAAIKTLSRIMRETFPENTHFGRMNEANLVAVSTVTSRNRLKQIAVDIQRKTGTVSNPAGKITVQYAVTIADGRNEDVLSAVETALKGMRACKMLDKNSAHSSLLDSLVQTLRESDDETEAHVRRTNELGQMLAQRMNLGDRDKNNLSLLCLLHDIGKVGIPLEILNKPGKLQHEEWEIMKSHTEKGYRIAQASHELAEIAELILHHHESWNGSGYPDGLKGEHIPLLSRIIAVVDAYDAMTNDRVYRKAMSRQDAIRELETCAGTQFDPHLVKEFLCVLEQKYPGVLEQDENRKTEEQADQEGKESEHHENVIDLNSYKDLSFKPLLYSRYILDQDNKIIEVDQNFQLLTGYSEQDIKMKSMKQLDLIPEEDREAYRDLVNDELNSKHEAFLEHRILRADGGIITVHCIGTQFFNAVTREGRTDIVITKISDESIRHQRSVR